jgi:S-layer homology domain
LFRSTALKSFSILAIILFARPALASSPLDGFNGARPQALGNAYVALADDAYAFYVNPAGLAELKQINIFSTYSQPGDNITLSGAGAVFPDLYGLTAGLGYRRQAAAGFTAPGGTTVDYIDQELAVILAKQISGGLSIGAAARFINSGYSGAMTSGQAFDLSVKRTYQPWLRLGLSLQDLGGRTNNLDGTVSELPYNLLAGVSCDLLGKKALFKDRNEVRLNADLSENGSNPLLWHLGLEWLPIEAIALRAGIDQNLGDSGNTSSGASTSSGIINNLTFGLGFSRGGLTLDYAMRRNGDQTGDVINYLSFAYEFSEAGTAEASHPAREEKVELPPQPETAPVKALKLKHFPDVAIDYWAREAIEMLSTAGIMWSHADGYFYPNSRVTRAEFETILSVAMRTPPVEVADGDKYMTRQEAASRLRLSSRLNRPNRPITRAELAQMIYQTDWAKAALKRLPVLEE